MASGQNRKLQQKKTSNEFVLVAGFCYVLCIIKVELAIPSDQVPRPFVRKSNLNTSEMLSAIYSEYTYWKDRKEPQQGDWSSALLRTCTITQS